MGVSVIHREFILKKIRMNSPQGLGMIAFPASSVCHQFLFEKQSLPMPMHPEKTSEIFLINFYNT